MDKRYSRLWRYVALALGLSVVAIVAISLFTMDRNTFKALTSIDAFSLAVVLALVLGKWVSECGRYNLIIRAMGRRMPLKNTAKAVMGSAFAGSVTPMRSATFPVQIFFFTRYGLSGGEATAAATTGGALNVMVTTLAMPAVLVLSASKIHLNMGLRTVLFGVAAVGFFVFLFLLFSLSDPERAARVLERLTPASLMKRPRFTKLHEKAMRGMEDFSRSLRSILKARRSTLALVILLTVAFWLSGAFVASWLLRGLGCGQFFWTALLAQMLVSSILPFAPVPGESGVAEAAFAGVFSIFLKKNFLALVTLAWRFFMLYLPLVALGAAFVFAMRDCAGRGRGRERPSRAIIPSPEIPAVEPVPEEL